MTLAASNVVTGTLHHDVAGVPAGDQPFRMDQAVICHLDDGESWQ